MARLVACIYRRIEGGQAVVDVAPQSRRRHGVEHLVVQSDGFVFAVEALEDARLVIQPAVAQDIAAQIASGSQQISGVMLESFLEDGNQNHEKVDVLKYGQSITDKCMSWDRTLPLFGELAEAVRKRRDAAK